MMATVVVAALLAALLAWAVARTARRARQGSACCGEHEATVARTGAAERSGARYPHRLSLEIGGMTCDNCARKVENALNALEGTWARVRIADHRADVRTREVPDEAALRAAVREAGYVVLKISDA